MTHLLNPVAAVEPPEGAVVLNPPDVLQAGIDDDNLAVVESDSSALPSVKNNSKEIREVVNQDVFYSKTPRKSATKKIKAKVLFVCLNVITKER